MLFCALVSLPPPPPLLLLFGCVSRSSGGCGSLMFALSLAHEAGTERNRRGGDYRERWRDVDGNATRRRQTTTIDSSGSGNDNNNHDDDDEPSRCRCFCLAGLLIIQ